MTTPTPATETALKWRWIAAFNKLKPSTRPAAWTAATSNVAQNLASRANADGSSIRPGAQAIADACALHRATVNEQRQLLVAWNLFREVSPGALGRAKVLALVDPAAWRLPIEQGADSSLPEPLRGEGVPEAQAGPEGPAAAPTGLPVARDAVGVQPLPKLEPGTEATPSRRPGVRPNGPGVIRPNGPAIRPNGPAAPKPAPRPVPVDEVDEVLDLDARFAALFDDDDEVSSAPPPRPSWATATAETVAAGMAYRPGILRGVVSDDRF